MIWEYKRGLGHFSPLFLITTFSHTNPKVRGFFRLRNWIDGSLAVWKPVLHIYIESHSSWNSSFRTIYAFQCNKMHNFFPPRGISFYYPLSSADDPKIGLFGKVQFLCRELKVEHNFLGGNAVQCKCNYILKQMTELDTYLLHNLGQWSTEPGKYRTYRTGPVR